MIIPVVPDEHYNIGDNVSFEIHVFENAEYSDVDDINITAGFFTWKKGNVEAEHSGSTGIYLANYSITHDDPPGACVNVSVKKGNASETIEFEIHCGRHYDVIINPISPIVLQPGDTFECEIITSKDDRPADIPDFEVWIYGSQHFEVNTTRVEEGIYQTRWEIPENLTMMGEYRVDIDGELDSLRTWGLTFYVTKFSVWYHMIEDNGSAVKIDLYISNLNGEAIPDAGVFINYDHDNNWDNPVMLVNSTTNNEGVAPIVLPYSNKSALFCDIAMIDDDIVHQTTLIIGLLLSGPNYIEDSFHVIVDEYLYHTGQHTYQFVAYNGSTALHNTYVYYYFVSRYDSWGTAPATEILNVGRSLTSSDGSFSIELFIPGSSYSIVGFFKTAFEQNDEWTNSTDGFRYEIDNVMFPFGYPPTDPEISIGIRDPLRLGSSNKLEVSVPKRGIFLIIDTEDINPLMLMGLMSQASWVQLLPKQIALSPGKHELEVVLPGFLPEKNRYTFLVFCVSEYEFSYNYLSLEPGESGSTSSPETGGGDDDNGFPGFEGITVAAALGVALIAVRRKRR